MFESIKNCSSEFTRRCGSYLKPFVSRNCFNPSILLTGDETLIAFRAFGETRKPFRAYLFSTDGRESSVLDLSEAMEKFGITNVADPKLFSISGEAWLTLNTGYSKTMNRLYISKVRPSLEEPRECTVENRQKVEKNWAFFEDKAACGRCIQSIRW
ncbi:MAG: hypothetical protein R3E58_00680 [Phycisphaerae bacterium]